MRFHTTSALAIAAVLAFSLAACAEDEAAPEVNTEASFPAGSTMAELAEQGSITIGVKSDQPGIGFKDPATGEYEGFDIEMAKIVAAELGFEPDEIDFTETVYEIGRAHV